MIKPFLFTLFFWGIMSMAWSQQAYPTNEEISTRLQTVASHPAVSLVSLAKTAGDQTIWALKIGTENTDEKPAIAVVGGVEGFRLLSVELALRFAEQLVNEHADVLNKTTFYVFPNLSPDAYGQYEAALKYERSGNSVPVDQDRDGQVSEDPYEDLNGDGYISLMRVETPIGHYKTHPGHSALMVRANRKKGEAGNYLVFTEGIDNDQDGKFNEDGEEGIAFNKNFTYKFPAFQPLAGDYPVSQKETRALVDYLFEQWNIFAFVTFGPANNLSAPLKYDKKQAQNRVITSMLEKDVEINQMISDLYNDVVSEKPFQQTNQGTDGDFFQWAYFHFGRLSFSTPGWWVPEVKVEKEEEAKEKQDQTENQSEEVNFMRWAEQQGLTDVFVPWEKIDHPDFPDKNVEVGGIKPFVMYNPPLSVLDSVASQHADFILKLAEMQPHLEFHNLKVDELDGGLTRITVDLFNNAPLPTHSELGERSRWLRKIRVDIKKDKEEILAGNSISLINKLGAYETQTLSWVIKGKGTIEIKAGAAHTGFATLNVKL